MTGPAEPRSAYTLSTSRSVAASSARRAAAYADLLLVVDPSRAPFASAQSRAAVEAALLASDAEHHRDWRAVRDHTATARRAEHSVRRAYVVARLATEQPFD